MTKTLKTTRILLVASLALNLAVVGVIAGVAFSGGPNGGSPRFDLSVGPLTRAMDDTRRDAVRSALRDSGAFDRRGARTDRTTLIAVLRADAFDGDAFRDALLRQRGHLRDAQDTVIDIVTDQIGNMTMSERAAFAERLEDQLRRARSRRRD